MSNVTTTIPTYGSAPAQTSAPSPATPTAGNGTTAGTGGSFPGASAGGTTSSQLAVIENDLKSVTPQQFFAAYKISSSDQQVYLSGTGSLNINAAYLAWYKSLGQSDRQSIQSQMVNVGAMPATDANGLDNPTALGAFTGLLGSTAVQGTNILNYLNQNASGTNALQNEISAGLTSAQKNANAPIIVTQTNPTTLAADITTAFDQALGYAPSAAQVQSFINQVHSQETNYAEAPRTESQDLINQAHAQESALNKIGPNGLDTVIQAYQAAVNGTKMPGAGTTQGPLMSSQQATPQVMSAPGATFPSTNTTTQPEGGVSGAVGNAALNMNQRLEGLVNDVGSILPGHPGFATSPPTPGTIQSQKTTTTQQPLPQHQLAPTHFGASTLSSYGGLYALNAADWAKAQAAYTPAKKFATPGQAPQSVQLAAFSTLLQDAYQTTGSWSKAVASVASGTPFGSAEGSHLSAFGNSVANEVNTQISALQSQINNSDVTVKVSAPDAAAEAGQAAKQSDPVGYYAANAGSFGEILNQMLTGAPLMYGQGTQDTFSGPVSAAAATSTPSSSSSGNGIGVGVGVK